MKIHETAVIGRGAVVVGDVTMEENTSVWYNAVIRADGGPVTIGRGSNIQDGAIVHMDPGGEVVIGEDVTVGHAAIVHGCHVGDRTVIGMGATILNHAVIGKDCIIGAGALVPQGKEIPDGSLVVGIPGKIVRTLTEEDRAHSLENAHHYVEMAKTMLPDPHYTR